MKPNRVEAAHGWCWINEGVVIFIKQPKVCLLFFLVSLLRWNGLYKIPMFGYLIVTLLTPLIVGILFWAYRQPEKSEFVFKSLITVVRSFSAELLRVGFIYAAAIILSAAITQIITDNATAAMGILGDTRAMSRFMAQSSVSPAFFALLLILATIQVLFFIAAWFAPALIVFNGYKATDAMKLSLKAAYTNASAFSLYGIILCGLWLTYLIVMYLIPGSILIPLGHPEYILPAASALSTLFWPIISPIIMVSAYTSYVHVFSVNSDNGETVC